MAKKILRILSTVFLIFLVIVVAMMFIMRVMGKTPSVFGYQVYFVATGSMEPTISVGDAVLVKKTPAEDIHKGDIITYMSTSEELRGMTVTHRVVGEPEFKNGTYYYQTQGDAAGATLDPVFPYRMVQGKVVTKLPIIGKVYSFFCKPYGLLTFVVIILALFGYELISLISSYKSLDNISDKYLSAGNDADDQSAGEDNSAKEKDD